MNCDAMMKATQVDGVYSADPMHDKNARHYSRLTYQQVLSDRLNVMDATAVVMCRDHSLPLRVYNLNAGGDLVRVARGEEVGTLVTNE